VQGHPIEKPETVATAIRIGKPARGEQALQAAEESGGRIVAASDGEILDMQRRLAGEGIWVEPASAAGLAGLANEIRNGKLDPAGKTIVAVCTGHGLKDAGIVTARMAEPKRIAVDLNALEEELGAS
jgi:threonine synthase